MLFRVRIVGMLESSILQGSLVIAEKEFMASVPLGIDGYRMLLLDGYSARKRCRGCGTEALDVGFEGLRPGLDARPRNDLAAFSAVENTYLSIFTVTRWPGSGS